MPARPLRRRVSIAVVPAEINQIQENFVNNDNGLNNNNENDENRLDEVSIMNKNEQE